MKIVVVGATGQIGARLVGELRGAGHVVAVASRSSGVDAVSGEGLAAVFAGAEVVVDVANSPSFEEKAVYEFFSRSTANMLEAGAAAGVKHHIALSIVGADGLTASPYFRAKMAQEKLIQKSSVPYTILRATQFFEFLSGIADACTTGDVVHLPDANCQPLAADDVVDFLVKLTTAQPTCTIVDLAGPDKNKLAHLVGMVFTARGDRRRVEASKNYQYFGADLSDDSLTPGPGAVITDKHLADWLEASVPVR